MIRKFLIPAIFVIAFLAGLYFYRTYQASLLSAPDAESAPSSQSQNFEEKTYTYTKNSLSETCHLNSVMACAVETAVKCTLDPAFDGCAEAKLPKFIFMQDESLNRPTEMSFEIVKIKPISSDLVEIHTDSTCNGQWFGLCQGRVIYVLVPNADGWRVKDIYAIEE